MKLDLSQYTQRGYLLLDLPKIKPNLDALKFEIREVFNLVSLKSGGSGVSNDADLINFRIKNQPLQFQGVKLLWGASSLFRLAGEPIFIDLLKDLGLNQPILEIQPMLRVDMPIDDQSIFSQHQDYAYNQGSANSVTIWIPLQDTGIDEGALLVEPGSHSKGIFPNKGGIITKDYKFNFCHCPVKFGQALIFNQKLVHQSGFNKSNKIRFSVQLRFSDLNDNQYADRGFYINHRITTEKFENEI